VSLLGIVSIYQPGSEFEANNDDDEIVLIY